MTMLSLGIDTATALGSLALARDGRVLARETIAEDAEHSAELGPALDRLLEQGGAALGDVAAIGVGLGPGSYTGLRVGIAFAKGLEFGLRVPLVGVPSFEAMAARVTRDACGGFDGTICALVDARMGGIYAGLYRVHGGRVEVVREPWVFMEGQVALDVEGPLVFAGPHEAVMRKLGTSFAKAAFRQIFPDAGYTALRAAELVGAAPPSGRFAALEPYYLRPSFAELSDQQERRK
jgi:tRNA threonylcarbamoyladenosine biosynthesis protein TsaB